MIETWELYYQCPVFKFNINVSKIVPGFPDVNHSRVLYYNQDKMASSRITGPSFISKNGNKVYATKKKIVAKKIKNIWDGPLYDWAIENNIDLDNLSEDDITLIKMFW